eukprot:gene17538-19288_t
MKRMENEQCDGNNNISERRTGIDEKCRYCGSENDTSSDDDDDSIKYSDDRKSVSSSRATSHGDVTINDSEDKTVSSSDHADDKEKNNESIKPSQSYIALIAMAILSNAERKMVLSDIYKYIIENYPFYKTQDKSWRNSIRHNLSLNDCFIKAGRSMNGKGNYWAIHPSNEEDFSKGDFRRRRTRRKVKRPAYPLGLYSELFSPYYATAVTYQADYRPFAQTARESFITTKPRAKPDADLMFTQQSPLRSRAQKYSSQQPRQAKKPFTIDSILGKDSKNPERNTTQNKPQIQRRHVSWTSQPSTSGHPLRSPHYLEYRPTYSTVYNQFSFEPSSLYPASPEAHQRLESVPHLASPNLRDTIREFSRLRTYSLR